MEDTRGVKIVSYKFFAREKRKISQNNHSQTFLTSINIKRFYSSYFMKCNTYRAKYYLYNNYTNAV